MKVIWDRAIEAHGVVAAAVLVLLGIAMALAPYAIPVLIVLLIVSLLWKHRPIALHRADPAFLRSPLPWIFLFYLVHVIGMAWTSNTSFGLFDLEIKLSLALFPLLFLLVPPTARRGGEVFQVAFILANALVVPICLAASAYATVNDVDIHWNKQFIASYFSLFLHPTYAAMYMCMALAMLYLNGRSPIGDGMRRAIALLLMIGILLMASKIAWVALLLLVVHILFAKWRDRTVRAEASTALIGFVIALVALLSLSEFAAERIREMKDVIADHSADRTSVTSSGLRVIAWDAAMELIRSAPVLGTGTGDVKDELMRIYKEGGYTMAYEQKLNAHSQFLQSWTALGLLGLLPLIASVVLPLYFAARSADHVFAAFLWILILNMTVESMLEVQAGVMFFALVPWSLMIASERSSHHDPVQPATHR